MIASSSKVSAFDTEGQWLEKVRPILGEEDRWQADKKIDWEKVSHYWHQEWDLGKPVLLEKSPPHLCRASDIARFFPGSFFIILYRNPYAVCEGLKRRHMKDESYRAIAEFWITTMKHQMNNINHLQNRLFFSYETFADDPGKICEAISQKISELGDMSFTQNFKVFERYSTISDHNRRQILRLSINNIREINDVLKEGSDIMEFFKYDIIKPKLWRGVTYFYFHLPKTVKKFTGLLQYYFQRIFINL